MVHIKKVEIYGFKSFGFKNTTVRLEPGLVSISGANGSGKSNILDAIIFATCETRPSMMRVPVIRKLMHDVGGMAEERTAAADGEAAEGSGGARPTRRGRPRMTRVTLYFDNTDRKIPVAADTVSITRELDESAESTYYLNGKKDGRNHLLDILDVAHVGPGYLNVVQQGTVTHIAEESSVQKRERIADHVGLSSFDEKIAAAEEQLDLADRKLEVSLASMGEVKKRIDELDVERNAKMRHDLIQSELKRYKALGARDELLAKQGEHGTKASELESTQERIGALQSELDSTRTRSSELEGERSAVMDTQDAYNKEKAQLAMRISQSVEAHSVAESAINMTKNRLLQIRVRLEQIQSEQEKITTSQRYVASEVRKSEADLEGAASELAAVDKELDAVDSVRDGILRQQSDAAALRIEMEAEKNLLYGQKSDVMDRMVRAQNTADECLRKAGESTDKLGQLQDLAGDLDVQVQKLDTVMGNSQSTISHLEGVVRELEEKRTRSKSDRTDLESILEKSTDAAARYESKIKMVKGFMHEDYTTAKLRENAESLGIEGLVYELMSWDAKYDRPVLAASSDWIKAIVVRDFATLVGISEAARSKNLPKFKIMPLEAVERLDVPQPVRVIGGVRTLGTLAEYVRCSDARYDHLRAFLFGAVVLVDDRKSAIAVSRSGYRAVTMSGEYFEARAGAVVVDMGSRISKITRLISMSSDVDGLLKSISTIRRHIQKKKRHEDKITSSIESHEARINMSRTRMRSAEARRDLLVPRLESLRRGADEAPKKIAELRGGADSALADVESCRLQLDRIRSGLDEASAKSTSDAQMDLEKRLGETNGQKSELEARQTAARSKHSRMASALSGLRSKEGELDSQRDRFQQESESLRLEVPELEQKGSDAARQKESTGAELKVLRQQEQELISSSGSSMDSIKQYDEQLRGLNEDDKRLSREIGGLQRTSDRLERDLELLSGRIAELHHIASSAPAAVVAPWLESGRHNGNNDDYDMTDAGAAPRHSGAPGPADMIRGLEAELASIEGINSIAPSKYVEITRGYKMSSMRKNALESERNSIVRFIERVKRDKRQTFLDAFEIVDSEIRSAFNKMTGGNAWLELQDEDNPEKSGISYMVQFPKKPHRDSTSISGGEKTLAAIVFILGLQKLQPSPFYMFDEIDAHLDAPNAEKLSNILAERARDSQFLVVSLKDSVVEKAGLVYGVFPKGGVSNVVTYKDRRMSQPVARQPDPARQHVSDTPQKGPSE